MKGMYVIAIAFLATWAVSAANSDQDQAVSKENYYPGPTPTKCPYPEPWENITTNLPHEDQCTKFYKCHVGQGVAQDCPLMIKGDPVTRLHYNRELQVCDWPWQAGCSECPLKNSDGSYPPPTKINVPGSCNQYYECINGQKYLRYCQPSHWCFSRTCQACVEDKRSGNCGPRREDEYRCKSNLDNGKTRIHPCGCIEYYRCEYPDEIEYKCEGGQHYSPTEGRCTSPDRANNPNPGCRPR